jgi:hypothetical protein
MSSPAEFDPWSASPEEALQAHAGHDPASERPDPLGQYQAAREVSAARHICLTADGGCAVLACLQQCLANGLMPPQWLAHAYLARHARVSEALVSSWDQAFGPPWPARTRLATVRRHRALKKAIHAAVWQRLAEDPRQPINRDLFEQIGEMRGIDVSGSQAEKLYFDALAEGAPNALHLRETERPTESAESLGWEMFDYDRH